MRKLASYGCLALAALALVSLASAAEKAGTLPDGNYKLTTAGTYGGETTDWLIKVETKDGKATGSLLSSNPRWATAKAQLGARYKEPALGSLTVEGNVVKIVVKNYLGNSEMFEAPLGDNPKKIKGAMDTGRLVEAAWLTPTDATELKPMDVFKAGGLEPYKKVQAENLKLNPLVTEINKTTDVDARAKLIREYNAVRKEIQEKVLPEAYALVLETKDLDDAAVLEAAMGLVKTAKATKAPADKVKGWAERAEKAAAGYGTRLVNETRLQQAEALMSFEPLAKLAAELAQKADKALPKNAPPTAQLRVLNALAGSQQKAGMKTELEATMTRMGKIDGELDKEYLANTPIKAEKFDGKMSKKPVVLELFTGAQCPPCVAADHGFDALVKTYEPRNLIALQYHMHIPGPDPLTNTDNEARWDYYTKAFPTNFRGVPSMALNGKPGPAVGGGVTAAKAAYDRMRQEIEKQFDADAGCEVQAKATRNGDKIDISVDVKGVKTPGDDIKLRLLVVEENVAYAGGNGIRFHHHIVRAMPGGPAGVTVKDKNFTHTASLDLAQLRKTLSAYLEDYNETKRPFPNVKRPMDMKHLSVVALVQDETLHEIIGAVQVEVGGK